MYYGLIIISVMIFGGNFIIKDVFRKRCGSSVSISLRFTLVSSAMGFAIMLAMNGFKIEFTPFTFAIALLNALNGFGFTLCSFKALGSINLSLYSLFSMLGGMALPFAQGIIFYGESMTVAKAVCFALIVLALLMTLERGEKKRGGGIYYVGIFVLNGMSGILTKIFVSAPFEKTSAEGYSLMTSGLSAIISACIILVMLARSKDQPRIGLGGSFMAALGGICNRMGNFLLVIALAHVDASVQYPMVTGGVMIVSTAACFFTDSKPSRREIASVCIAFLAMLLLFLIPV